MTTAKKTSSTAIKRIRGDVVFDVVNAGILIVMMLVVLSCGYANESHFCVSFKRECGFSPMEFRKTQSDVLLDE
ncbi:MAG: AraC family transcriptional regulator [Clostridia bacterium]|nr:AraC family transcriptional regulator [Clostridia bacterium]MDD6682864.1 AraC family transcriptional regulator [Clostridiales bacterium]